MDGIRWQVKIVSRFQESVCQRTGVQGLRTHRCILQKRGLRSFDMQLCPCQTGGVEAKIPLFSRDFSTNRPTALPQFLKARGRISPPKRRTLQLQGIFENRVWNFEPRPGGGGKKESRDALCSTTTARGMASVALTLAMPALKK